MVYLTKGLRRRSVCVTLTTYYLKILRSFSSLIGLSQTEREKVAYDLGKYEYIAIEEDSKAISKDYCDIDILKSLDVELYTRKRNKIV